MDLRFINNTNGPVFLPYCKSQFDDGQLPTTALAKGKSTKNLTLQRVARCVAFTMGILCVCEEMHSR